jgi:CDP-paratose 2-epimerase
VDSTAGARRVVITGGAGFIGTNLADRLAREGERVLLFDDLSRPGVERNVRWLTATHPTLVEVERGDTRSQAHVARVVREASSVFHLAAQVAVTTSLTDPIHDFEVNARGTLNVLEALRARSRPPPLVFTSTNKVYGALDDVEVVPGPLRYEPPPGSPWARGIGEARPVEFHSPYGCSKGSADQYVLDYARTYRLPAIVFRMSCIYGPHQHGNEDQGWVAHFLLRACAGQPVVVYGDGAQVRDVLNADDLVRAFLSVREDIDELAGKAFNVGGGPDNTISLLELLELIEELQGLRPPVSFAEERVGDQRWYVSDTSRLREATGWRPRVQVEEGIETLYRLLASPRRLVAATL